MSIVAVVSFSHPQYTQAVLIKKGVSDRLQKGNGERKEIISRNEKRNRAGKMTREKLKCTHITDNLSSMFGSHYRDSIGLQVVALPEHLFNSLPV